MLELLRLRAPLLYMVVTIFKYYGQHEAVDKK